MSYSLSISVPAGEDVADAVAAAFDASEATKANAGPHAAIVAEHAASVAKAVARPEDSLTVSINGHYNKDCEPTPGWASCYMQVSVTQVYPPA